MPGCYYTRGPSRSLFHLVWPRPLGDSRQTMRPYRCLLLLLVILFCGTRGIAAEDSWIDGGSAWGARGLYRVDAASSRRAGTISLSLLAEFSSAHDLLVPKDSNIASSERLHVGWA